MTIDKGNDNDNGIDYWSRDYENDSDNEYYYDNEYDNE